MSVARHLVFRSHASHTHGCGSLDVCMQGPTHAWQSVLLSRLLCVPFLLLAVSAVALFLSEQQEVEDRKGLVEQADCCAFFVV